MGLTERAGWACFRSSNEWTSDMHRSCSEWQQTMGLGLMRRMTQQPPRRAVPCGQVAIASWIHRHPIQNSSNGLVLGPFLVDVVSSWRWKDADRVYRRSTLILRLGGPRFYCSGPSLCSYRWKGPGYAPMHSRFWTSCPQTVFLTIVSLCQ